jgi:hypothetical protein
MIRYGINVDLVKKLIDKIIMSKTDLFDSYEINMDDNGMRIFIFFTFYFDNIKLASFEKEYYENLTQQYGDLDEVPDEEYRYCDDYIRTELLYVPIHKLLFFGMGIDNKKYRISVETVE